MKRSKSPTDVKTSGLWVIHITFLEKKPVHATFKNIFFYFCLVFLFIMIIQKDKVRQHLCFAVSHKCKAQIRCCSYYQNVNNQNINILFLSPILSNVSCPALNVCTQVSVGLESIIFRDLTFPSFLPTLKLLLT